MFFYCSRNLIKKFLEFFQVHAQQYQKHQEKIIVFLRPCTFGVHDPQKETRRIDQQQPQFVTDTSQQKSTDTTNPSIDSCELPLIDTSIRTSIDTRPRDMVATLILVRDENGDLHDQEGHMRNATGQRLDDQRDVIPDHDADATAASQAVYKAARPRTLAEYNRPDQYYGKRSAIRPLAIQRNNFELNSQCFTLVAHTPYCGLSHEHLIDYLDRFEDLVSAIKANGVP